MSSRVKRCLRVVIWQMNDGFALVRVLRGPAFQQIGNRHRTIDDAREAARFVQRKNHNIAVKDMRYEP